MNITKDGQEVLMIIRMYFVNQGIGIDKKEKRYLVKGGNKTGVIVEGCEDQGIVLSVHLTNHKHKQQEATSTISNSAHSWYLTLLRTAALVPTSATLSTTIDNIHLTPKLIYAN